MPKSLSFRAGGCCVKEACPGDNTDQQDRLNQRDMSEEQELASSAEYIWYQSTISLKGITQVSSQPIDVGGFM